MVMKMIREELGGTCFLRPPQALLLFVNQFSYCQKQIDY